VECTAAEEKQQGAPPPIEERGPPEGAEEVEFPCPPARERAVPQALPVLDSCGLKKDLVEFPNIFSPRQSDREIPPDKSLPTETTDCVETLVTSMSVVEESQGPEVRSSESPSKTENVSDQIPGTSQCKPGSSTSAVALDILKPGMETYFETSTQSSVEESPQPQSYYEISTAARAWSNPEAVGAFKLMPTPGQIKLEVTAESITQRPEEQPQRHVHKMPLEQRILSPNITIKSPTGVTKSSTFLHPRLSPIIGSFDDSAAFPPTPSMEQHLSTTPAPSTAQAPEEALTKIAAMEQNVSFDQSSDLSEMLDLAGALPKLSLEKRVVDPMRRKSVPVNVSALVGSSLAKLALGNQASRGVGEDLGYCVFNEYLGPMPSPADLPSSGDAPYQSFPSMDADDKLDQKEIVCEIILKSPTAEKKDVTESPRKSSVVLEKAVPSGIKPDHLRIPVVSPNRLTEFLLESGLPGDMKIQAIPEVDVEKDPSREASPIPPDSSFSFSRTDGNVPQTPTTPKSPVDGSLNPEEHVKDTQKDAGTESQVELVADTKKFAQKEPEFGEDTKDLKEEHCKTGKIEVNESDVTSSSNEALGQKTDEVQESIPPKLKTEEAQEHVAHSLELSEKPVDEKGTRGLAEEIKEEIRLQSAAPIIIIPQAQLDEDDGEEEDDEVELAEEPQEVMEEASDHLKEESRKEIVAVLEVEGVEVVRVEPKSDTGLSNHSNNGEPVTDTSQLSLYSDRRQMQSSLKGGEDRVKEENQSKDLREAAPEAEKREEDAVEGDVEGMEKEQNDDAEQEEGKAPDVDKETFREEEASPKEIEQMVDVASDPVREVHQTTNEDTAMDVSVLDTDSGWMDTQGTLNFF